MDGDEMKTDAISGTDADINDDEISEKSEDGDKSLAEMEVFVVHTYQLIIDNN